jgi:hypothetical protein
MQDRVQHRVIGFGHNNPPAPVTPAWTTAPGLVGRRALIRRRGRAVGTAGRARADLWELTFERETAPDIEPLMGWTGGDDTLATEVVLTFPTRAQAVAYAERQGLAYRVAAEPARPCRARSPRVRSSNRPASPTARPARSPAPPPAALPDLERALVNPAAVFDTPAAVLDHPRLLPSCKREILRRWAWDEYLKEVAAAEGMAEGEPSRLDAVTTALLALGETWRPHPSAPAAAVPIIREAEPRRAAA